MGRAHGRDGSFYVDAASHPLPEGTSVTIGGRPARIVGRAGTPERPLVRLSGLDEPERVAALRGEPLLVPLERAPLEAGEWLAEDLMGCEVPGLGRVGRVLAAPSCDLLEVGPDAVLVPLVADAVKRVDTEAGRIEIDRGFLGLDEESPHET